jgi:diguanylate cyclase (GGDEF)-like protein
MAIGQTENLSALETDQDIVLQSRLLKAHLELMPTAVWGNIFNAMLLVVPFVTTFSYVFLCAIFATLATGSLLLLRFWSIHKDFPSARANALTRQAELYAFFISSTWGTAIYLLMREASDEQATLLGMLSAGMMAAATLTCATTPKAARVFVLPIASALLLCLFQRGGLESSVTIALVVSFVVVLNRSISVTFENHRERLVGQMQLAKNAAEAAENAATVRLLLNDFEEQGSDWLWEVGADGCLVAPSKRFAQVAERPIETLAGTQLIALFDEVPERDILADHLISIRAFREIVVPLMISGEQHWWSLSGQPFCSTGGDVRLRGVATDITATRKAEVKVAYMAHYDGLTDLPNRFLFNDTLNRALHRQKEGISSAVLSLDLDHFKSVNDTLGHPIGDKLLQIISRRIETCLNNRDMVSRLGGDEFAVLLNGVDNDSTIKTTADTILRAISAPVEIEGHQILPSASIGVVVLPAHGSDVDILMKHVDLALYSAKADGRNRVSFFDASMDEAAQARRMVEVDLRGAMNRDELELHYQPLVNLESGETVAYEALVRWHHPTRGLVMPDDFVSIAEETGLIVQLGEWVIRNAVAEVARWPENISVSVNLSPHQMKSSGLISTVLNALASAGVAPNRLEMEITETVLMHETEVNLATLHKLRDIGVRIALDDFGTGYSSLNYLRSFPFDKIKIDRCFVENVDSSGDCQAIIRAVTGLATSLGMVTTAEGVENEQQLSQLRAEGCTQVQGYLFSKAVPVSELTDLRSGHRSKLADYQMLPAADITPIRKEAGEIALPENTPQRAAG